MLRGDAAGPGFSVCCMARESADVVRRFVAHYVALGAAEIFVTFDGPETPAVAALRSEPRLRLRFVDAPYWQDALGDKASIFERRLSHAAEHAWRQTTSPWLLVTDVDELLIARTPVGAMLAAIPGEIESFAVPSAEAVWGPGDDLMAPFGSTWFRRPVHGVLTAPVLGVLLYGREARFFSRGILSHTRGKHFVRRNARIDRIGSHGSFRDGREVTVSFREQPALRAGNEMAHFDAVSFERWHEKFRRRYAGEIKSPTMRGQRRAQVDALARAFGGAEGGDREAALDLFRRLYRIGTYEARMLEITGTGFRQPIFSD